MEYRWIITLAEIIAPHRLPLDTPLIDTNYMHISFDDTVNQHFQALWQPL